MPPTPRPPESSSPTSTRPCTATPCRWRSTTPRVPPSTASVYVFGGGSFSEPDHILSFDPARRRGSPRWGTLPRAQSDVAVAEMADRLHRRRLRRHQLARHDPRLAARVARSASPATCRSGCATRPPPPLGRPAARDRRLDPRPPPATPSTASIPPPGCAADRAPSRTRSPTPRGDAAGPSVYLVGGRGDSSPPAAATVSGPSIRSRAAVHARRPPAAAAVRHRRADPWPRDRGRRWSGHGRRDPYSTPSVSSCPFADGEPASPGAMLEARGRSPPTASISRV